MITFLFKLANIRKEKRVENKIDRIGGFCKKESKKNGHPQTRAAVLSFKKVLIYLFRSHGEGDRLVLCCLRLVNVALPRLKSIEV